MRRPRDFPSERYLANLTRIPVQDTYNIRDVLVKIKKEVNVNRLMSQRDRGGLLTVQCE